MTGCYIPIPVVCDDCNKAPHIGENGNWWIGDVDTGVKAQGSDGTTPHIGENGNWFLGETDTGVKAGGTGGEEYSTTATRIGTWIDGRPLYRRVFRYSGTIPAYDQSEPNGNARAEVVPSSQLGAINRVIRIYGSAITSAGHTIPFPEIRLSAVYEPSAGVVMHSKMFNTANDTAIVVEYT